MYTYAKHQFTRREIIILEMFPFHYERLIGERTCVLFDEAREAALAIAEQDADAVLALFDRENSQ